MTCPCFATACSFHRAILMIPWGKPYLELLVAVEKQHVHRIQLRDISVPLKLLSDLCADGGDGHVERVHGLNLGRLFVAWPASAISLPPVSLPSSTRFSIASSSFSQYARTYRAQPFLIALEYSSLRIRPVDGYCSRSASPFRFTVQARHVQERVRCARYVGLIILSCVASQWPTRLRSV